MGRPPHPDTVTKRFKKDCQSAGVPYIKLHGLRHLFASVALSEGANPKAVSEVLGHADIHTTLAIYSQFIPGIHDAVVQAVDAFLLGSTEGS
jgi:integrase